MTLTNAYRAGARDAFAKFANLPAELVAEALYEHALPPEAPPEDPGALERMRALASTGGDHLNALATESTQRHVGPLSVLRRLIGRG